MSIRSSITQFNPQITKLDIDSGTYGLTIKFTPGGDNDTKFTSLKISGCDIAPAKKCLLNPNDPDCVIFQFMTIKPCGDFVQDELPISLVIPGKNSDQKTPNLFAVLKPRGQIQRLKIKVSGGWFNTLACIRYLPSDQH